MPAPVPSWVHAGVAEAVRALAGVIATRGAAALAGEAPALARDVDALAARLVAAVAEVGDARRLAVLASDATTLPAPPETTASRRRQAARQRALAHFVRVVATIELARRMATTPYADRAEADDLRVRLVALLDAHVPAVGVDTHVALRALRAAVAAHLRAAADALPPLITVEPSAVQPSLVLAYRLSGAVDRADEIAARSGAIRPGLVPTDPFEAPA